MDWATCRREGEDETLESWRAGHGVFSRRRARRSVTVFPRLFPSYLRTSASSTTPRAAAARSFYRQTPQRSWPACALRGTKRGPWAAGARRPAGEAPHDVDIATNAPPETVRHIFSSRRVLDTGVRHGTVSVEAGGAFLEITTYRAEGPYSDGRRPDSVRFVGSLREDLAAAILPSTRWPGTGSRSRTPSAALPTCRSVSSAAWAKRMRVFPRTRCAILRALRFASVLGFRWRKGRARRFPSRPVTPAVSQERTAAELTGLLCGKNVRSVLLEYVAVLAPFCRRSCRSSASVSTIRTTSTTPGNTPPPRSRPRRRSRAPPCRAPARHCKPAVFSPDESGTGHFYGHAEVSERMADDIFAPPALSRRSARARPPSGPVPRAGPDASPKSVRRWLSRLGPRDFFALLALRRATAPRSRPSGSAFPVL